MNYPIESLAIIGPILFIVLMIGFPVIGVFGGWKRALYWGGGNFLFYVIGMLIWRFAGTSIVAGLAPMIKSALEGLGVTGDVSPLVASITAPVFFILVMLVANIILVICYYTFAKRLMGLKKNKKENKKEAKQSSANKQAVAKANTKKGVKYEVINKVGGGVGMTVLMLPVVFTGTEAIMYATTSVNTRKANGFASGMYNMLRGVNGAFNWFSYYGNNTTAKDFDALWSTLSLNTNKITYIDPKTGEEVTGKTGLEAAGAIISGGVTNIVSETANIKDTASGKVTQESAKEVKDALDNFATSWNDLVNGDAGDDVRTIFQSENVTSLFEEVIKTAGSEKVTVTQKEFEDVYDKGKSFDDILSGYTSKEIKLSDDITITLDEITEPVETTQECFNNVVKTISGAFDLSQLTDTQKTVMQERIEQMTELLVYVAK